MDKAIICKGKFCDAPKSIRSGMFALSPMLEGGRRFLNDGRFRFENTTHNRKCAEGLGHSVDLAQIGSSGLVEAAFEVVSRSRPPFTPPAGYFSPYKDEFVAFTEYDHQNRAFKKFKDLKSPESNKYIFGLFAEAGTGKTKIAIDLLNYSFCKGRIDAVLLLAKKGVHHQWVHGEIKENGIQEVSPIGMFTQSDIEFDAHSWDGKKVPEEIYQNDGRMKWLSVNFDAPIHKKAWAIVSKFLEAHKGRLAVIGDETHYWMTPRSSRTKVGIVCNDPEWAVQSGLMTGTPIAKNLVDEWSQLKMLDPSILGHKYITTFKAEYCVMGGFEGRQIVGSRNIDRFKDLTSPYIFRVLKADCLDLPPKQYKTLDFKLHKDQQQAIAELVQTQSFMLGNGELVDWEGPAGVRTKVQEVSNGYLRFDDQVVARFPNPRLETAKTFFEENPEKAIIWVRFKEDIKELKAVYGDNAVEYHGSVKDADRVLAKENFMDKGGANYFLATSAAAEGLDGLQKVCSLAMYYSNSYNSIHRWQSEDRIDRIGMNGSALYIDLVARGCVDYPLLNNLKHKTAFSAMVLDVDRELGLLK